MHEQTVRRYFDCWLLQDAAALSCLFSADCLYTECYGPQYDGLEQIRQWFADWNRRGRVLRWDLHEVIEAGDTLVCRWYFECIYDENVDGFDGVSVIRFTSDGLIREAMEYQSKPQHHQPYTK